MSTRSLRCSGGGCVLDCGVERAVCHRHVDLRLLQMRTRLEEVMRTDSSVCQRVHDQCANGHANMLFMLATPAPPTNNNNSNDNDDDDDDKLEFSDITPEYLRINGTPYVIAVDRPTDRPIGCCVDCVDLAAGHVICTNER